MEIDHVFMFIEPEGREIEALRRLGLTATYRRSHAGQGTANVCFAFDNLFLELLWITSREEATSPAVERTGLWPRSQWRSQHSCPFGLAWRAADPATVGIACWDYRPPYLPAGTVIPMAVDSDDTRQPLLFQSPGDLAPSAWPPQRRGVLQAPGGWGEVLSVELTLPASVAPCGALETLARRTGLRLLQGPDSGYALALVLGAADRAPPGRLILPGVSLSA